MIFVVKVGGQTLRIFASSAQEAAQRMATRFPGETIGTVREGGRSGDSNFRLISPTSVGPDGTPSFDPPGGAADPSDGAAGALEGGQLPTPADLGPGAQPVTPAVPGGQLELQSPFGAFTNFLGRFTGLGSDDPRSAARTFAESQFSPLRAAFGGQQLATGIDPAAEGFGNEFAQFLNQGGINPRQRLGDAFRSLQTAAPGADPQGFLGQALNAQTANEAAEIFNLARNLQGSRISPLISSRFSQPTNEELFGRFAGGRQAGSGLNALDFARRQFGLGQLGF